MLFMTIVTWEPEKTNELIKRFAEKGTVTSSKGGKAIGNWTATAGGQAFRLIDTDDSKAMAMAGMVWNDIAKMEVIPVIETEELMKVLASKK